MRAISPTVWGENHHNESRDFTDLLEVWDSLWDAGKEHFGIIQNKGWLEEETKVEEVRKTEGKQRGKGIK